MNKGCGYDLSVRAQNINSWSLEKLKIPQLVTVSWVGEVVIVNVLRIFNSQIDTQNADLLALFLRKSNQIPQVSKKFSESTFDSLSCRSRSISAIIVLSIDASIHSWTLFCLLRTWTTTTGWRITNVTYTHRNLYYFVWPSTQLSR